MIRTQTAASITDARARARSGDIQRTGRVRRESRRSGGGALESQSAILFDACSSPSNYIASSPHIRRPSRRRRDARASTLPRTPSLYMVRSMMADTMSPSLLLRALTALERGRPPASSRARCPWAPRPSRRPRPRPPPRSSPRAPPRRASPRWQTAARRQPGRRRSGPRSWPRRR